jgi:hypothetical protein
MMYCSSGMTDNGPRLSAQRRTPSSRVELVAGDNITGHRLFELAIWCCKCTLQSYLGQPSLACFLLDIYYSVCCREFVALHSSRGTHLGGMRLCMCSAPPAWNRIPCVVRHRHHAHQVRAAGASIKGELSQPLGPITANTGGYASSAWRDKHLELTLQGIAKV